MQQRHAGRPGLHRKLPASILAGGRGRCLANQVVRAFPGRDPRPVLDAGSEAIAALDPSDRTHLRLKGFVRIPVMDYLAVPNPPPPEQIAALI